MTQRPVIPQISYIVILQMLKVSEVKGAPIRQPGYLYDTDTYGNQSKHASRPRRS